MITDIVAKLYEKVINFITNMCQNSYKYPHLDSEAIQIHSQSKITQINIEHKICGTILIFEFSRMAIIFFFFGREDYRNVASVEDCQVETPSKLDW